MGTFLGNMIYVLEALGFAFFADSGQSAAEPAQPTPVASHQPLAQSFFTSAQPRSDGHKAYPASALVKGRSSTGHGDWIRTTDRMRLGEVLLEPREQAEKAG